MNIAGTFKGTGATLHVGIGFKPDWVRLFNIEGGGTLTSIFWSRHFRSAEILAGIKTADGVDSELTIGAGIIDYDGGDTMAAASTAHLKRDRDDRRDANTPTYEKIDTWTLGSSTNKTGKFNAAANSTYVGEGSIIIIKEAIGGAIKRARVTAFTNYGEVANYVTLDRAVASGEILFLGGKHDYIGCVAGDVTSAGFTVGATTGVNTSSAELNMFEAGTYDD